MQKTNYPYIEELGNTLDIKYFIEDKKVFELVSSKADMFINYKNNCMDYSVLDKKFKNKLAFDINYENDDHVIKLKKFINFFLDASVYLIPITFDEAELKEIRTSFYPYLIAKCELSIDNYFKALNSLISIYTGQFLIMDINFDFLIYIKNGDKIVIYYN